MSKTVTETNNSYFYLNNLVNITKNGEIPFHYDKEALKAYFKEHVIPNTKVFSLRDKINYLIKNDYIEEAVVKEYSFSFIQKLFDKLAKYNFRFKSFLDTNDSMLSIILVVNSAFQLSRLGGGVGVNLSNLREAGDQIKKIKNVSSGVVLVMKLLEDSFSYSNQLGQKMVLE